MTPDEAQRIVNAYQSRTGQAPADEFMRYWQARQVLATAGRQQLSGAQRGFLAAAKLPAEPQREGAL